MRKPAQSTGWAEPSEENSAAPTTRLIRLIDMLWHFLRACSSKHQGGSQTSRTWPVQCPLASEVSAEHGAALGCPTSSWLLFPISDPQQASDMLRWGQGGKSFWRGFWESMQQDLACGGLRRL